MSSYITSKRARAAVSSTSNIIAPDTDGFITVTLAQFRLLKRLNLLKQIGTRQYGNEFDAFYAREAYGRPTTKQELMYRCYLIDPPLEEEDSDQGLASSP